MVTFFLYIIIAYGQLKINRAAPFRIYIMITQPDAVVNAGYPPKNATYRLSDATHSFSIDFDAASRYNCEQIINKPLQHVFTTMQKLLFFARIQSGTA